jgi:HEAT repeat protein
MAVIISRATRRRWILLGLIFAISGCRGRTTDHWLQQLGESDVSRRREAIRELTVADPDRAVPALAAALRDENHYVRHDAAIALGKFGPAAVAAIPALKAALKDPEKSVRTAVQAALKKIAAPAASDSGVR